MRKDYICFQAVCLEECNSIKSETSKEACHGINHSTRCFSVTSSTTNVQTFFNIQHLSCDLLSINCIFDLINSEVQDDHDELYLMNE